MDIDLVDPKQMQSICIQSAKQDPELIHFFEKLTFMLYTFLSQAIHNLSIEDTNQLQPHLEKYVHWARQQINFHRLQKMTQHEATFESLAEDDIYIGSVCQELEQTNAQGKIYVAVGRQLHGILRSEVDVLEMLFQSDLMSDHYHDLSHNSRSFEALNCFLNALSYKNPHARYLEIGAGTGGSTSKIFESILHHRDPSIAPSMYSEYTFTDVSEAFFETARAKFAKYPNATCRRLDIEADPISQGFEQESYDVIVAANVVYATASLQQTLQHVRRLLRPGGRLIL